MNYRIRKTASNDEIEDKFRESIKKEPLNEELRISYADWLIKNNRHNEAEFVLYDKVPIGMIVNIPKLGVRGVVMSQPLTPYQKDEYWYRVKTEQVPGKLDAIIEWDQGKRVMDFHKYWSSKDNFHPTMSISRTSLVPTDLPLLKFLQMTKTADYLRDTDKQDMELEEVKQVVVPEEMNEDLEARDMENGPNPGTDNLVIDKNDNPGELGSIVAKLKELAILLKSGWSKDVIEVLVKRIG